MIEEIGIENFRSIREARLRLGRLNFFIGANASGKSNLLDALRVLRGIARGSTVGGLFNGESRVSASGGWGGVRGGLRDLPFKPREGPGSGASPALPTRLAATLSGVGAPPLEYEFAFSAEGHTTHERLRRGSEDLFSFDGRDTVFEPGSPRATAGFPALFAGSELLFAFRAGLAGRWEAEIRAWCGALTGMQFLALDPGVLRQYASAAPAPHLGERGENLAAVIHALKGRPKAAYVEWLRELRPDEVTDADAKPGAGDDLMLRMWEHEREFLAPVLSEGTLRFAAIAAAFFQADLPSVLAIEEVDNGIHPSRLRLLVELLRGQTERAPVQVVATTHSPVLLAWLKPEEYATTFLCRRDPETGASRICPLSAIPQLTESLRSQPLSELVAEGWLEHAL